MHYVYCMVHRTTLLPRFREFSIVTLRLFVFLIKSAVLACTKSAEFGRFSAVRSMNEQSHGEIWRCVSDCRTIHIKNHSPTATGLHHPR